MNTKEILLEVEALKNDFESAFDYLSKAIKELHKETKYAQIVEIYNKDPLDIKEWCNWFEFAYALNHEGKAGEAKLIYERIIESSPENSSALNNLHLILLDLNQTKAAWKLIQKAYDIAPDDEIVARNYSSLLSKINENEERDRIFKESAANVANENEYVLGKLKCFLANVGRDGDFQNNQIPIARWKIKVLIGAENERAISLFDQWLKKNYIHKTSNKGSHGEPVYIINHYLQSTIKGIVAKEVNSNWLLGSEQINASYLESLGFYSIHDRIRKAKKGFREPLTRDINELFIAYIMQSWKTVIILSGSIVEMLLIHDLEKKKYSQVSYSRQGRNVTRALYDCDLGDLLSHYEENHLLEKSLMHLANVARLFRNFIHPGKELRDEAELDKAKAEISFIGTLEIFKEIL